MAWKGVTVEHLMSFQAMTWAASHKWGGCSGRSTIYAIANHANDLYFCWARQETLAEESEQSTDSVGRRISEFVAAGEVRRIKLRRFGRRTHDFLILKPSPFFAAPIDDIEPFIPRGCDIMDDASSAIDAAAICGSVENDESVALSQEADRGSTDDATAICGSAVPDLSLPQPAVHATALVRQQEPLFEPKKDSPPTPPLGGRSKDQISDSKRASFERFAKMYPAPIVDYEATLRLWASMSDPDSEDAIKGARGYRDYLAELAAQKRSRNVRDAHRWLKNRQWTGFLGTPGANRGDESQSAIWITEGSAEVAAWAVFNRICQHETRFTQGRILVATQWPPPVGDGLGDWMFVIEETGQFAAWMRRLREGPPRTIGLRSQRIDGRDVRGLWVPTEWPPPKLIPGTLCTDEDLQELGMT